MEGLVCVNDFEKEAMRKLGRSAREYYSSGADDEITVKENVNSYSRILIRPRMLRNVSTRDLSTTVMGKKVAVPLGISPTALQKLAHEDGECGTARAAETIGGIMIVAFFTTSSYEEVALAAPNARKWFQFFVHKDRSITEGVIRRAEMAGFEAMVLTLDCQYVGKRRASARNPIEFPQHLNLPNDTGDANGELNMSKLHDSMDYGVTWEAIPWLKRISKLPLVLKGVQTVEDAEVAVELGVDGLIVSNHGGRQIDTTPATIDILPSIVRAVGHRTEVYIDGGIRRGTDVFKAIALGAKMVEFIE
ncbi:unnamed protein product [Orchesella dallaii]|uniref:FMN hydroxy acid dehydrogenase domain-containing protein n=1 Tax=Orchesella dallaii TaxID=48710 RepID=A0ABP1QH35_9HEXA